ncbi:MAG: sugar transferase [Planctomycetes bacterium]|nr:sugar transferase [Planctomycetota bacterium]
MKRWIDIAGAAGAIVLFSPIMLLVAIAVKMTSRGPVFYWSDRIGRENHVFRMPKFRTMRVDTPQVATHLLANPVRYLTPIGAWIRAASLDELPQLWSVLVGDMSLVGPRPALFNQDDLIALRTERGVHRLTPGLTGWAQINGRDELSIPEKVAYDAHYLAHRSLAFDAIILARTFIKVARREGIARAGSRGA